MRMLLANYFNETDQPHDINEPGVTNGIASSRARFDEMLGMDSSDLTADEIKALQPEVFTQMTAFSDQRHWIKVHDAQMTLADGRWLFPPGVSGVVIYLIRNPLDVAVSLAFHDGHQDFDKAVTKLCNNQTTLAGLSSIQLPQIMGGWGDHVISWVDQDKIPVMIVRYEDLLIDTEAKLSEVLAFARPDIEVDLEQVSHAAKETTFDKLTAAEEDGGFREKPQRADRFFRKGEAGDWKNHLASGQVARISDAYGEVMNRFGYSA